MMEIIVWLFSGALFIVVIVGGIWMPINEERVSWYVGKTKGSHRGLLNRHFEMRTYSNRKGERVYWLDGEVVPKAAYGRLEADFNQLAKEGFHPTVIGHFREVVVNGRVEFQRRNGPAFKAALEEYTLRKGEVDSAGWRGFFMKKPVAPYDFESSVFLVPQERRIAIGIAV